MGRDREISRLRATLIKNRRNVVLGGLPGVGKSRLSREVARLARNAGFVVVPVSATRASMGIPLGAFAPLLPLDTPRSGPIDDSHNLIESCVTALLSRADAAPLLLTVDDAHLLDDISATLVRRVIETDAVVVLATVHAGEPLPPPLDRLHTDEVEWLQVRGLLRPDVTVALETVLGGRVDEPAVVELDNRSQGNMLVLTELVVGALEQQKLQYNEVWRLVGPLSPNSRLVELVEARLAELTRSERELLEIVALGEPLGPAEVSRLSDPAVVPQLEARALLKTSTRESRYHISLAHPIYGDVLRERMPSLRAGAIARELAASVEATGARRREDLLRIATWRLLGGGAEPELMYRAAVEARWRYDFALAERLARAAIDTGAGFEAELLVAQLAGLQGHPETADTELAALAARAGTPTERAQIAIVRLDNQVVYSGSIDKGLQITRDSLNTMPHSELRDEILARHAALLLAKEGPRNARAVVEPLLASSSDRVLASACKPAAYSLGRLGRLDEALATARRGYRAQMRLPVPTDWYPFMFAFYIAEALEHAGRFTEASRLASERYQEGVRNRSLEQQAMFRWQMAKAVSARGHIATAVRHARASISIYQQLGRVQFIDFSLIYVAQALALGGQTTQAQQALDELDRLGVSQTYFMGADLLYTQGWVAASGGNLRQARDIFLQAADTGENIGDRVGALAALHAVARIGYASQVRDRVAELAKAVEGPLAQTRAMHVQALADSHSRRLMQASMQFERLGAMLLASEAAADCAVSAARRGDFNPQSAIDRQNTLTAEQCPAADTPALRAVEIRSSLKQVEWEAAQLAATGLTSREIAGELGLSARTVDNRLQSVYGKLLITGRQELARLMNNSAESR